MNASSNRAVRAGLLLTCALVVAAAPAGAQGGSWPIANSSESEISVSVAYDGANFLVGIQGDVNDNSTVCARFASPGGVLGAFVTTDRTGGVPFLAFGGGRYLMVWEDDITSPDDHIYGMFVFPSGTHGAPFPISTAAGEEAPAGVAYAGGSFLVAYSRASVLHARQISTTGTVGPELSITGATFAQVEMNNVCSNGTSYLAVWTDDTNKSEVKARRVRVDGTLDPVFTVNASAHRSDDPLGLGTDGTDYLVVWGDEVGGAGSGEWDLYGQVVTPAGTLLGSPFAVSTGPGHQFGPFVASDGSGFLVTWTDMRNDANQSWACDPGEGTCWDIYGRYVGPGGGTLGGEWAIVDLDRDQFGSPLCFGAGKYLMAWTDGPWIDEGGDVYGLFLPPVGVVTTYCTAKVNSLGCLPHVLWSGEPGATSTDPFLIKALDVLNNKNGIFFYGKNGRQATPFMGGTMCVAPPRRRTPIQSSGGNPPPNDCSGEYSIDFNAWIQLGKDPGLVPGQMVNGQYWSRDAASPFNVGLSDGIEFFILP